MKRKCNSILSRITNLWNTLFDSKTTAKSENGDDKVVTIPDMEIEPFTIQLDDEMPAFLKEDGDSLITSGVQSQDECKRDDISIEETLLDSDLNNNADIQDNISTEEKEEIITSMLDNKPLVKMFEECSDIIGELDRLAPRFQSTDSKILLELVNDRIRQAMYLAGGKPISDDYEYNCIKHTCPANLTAKDGMTIKNFIESGVMLEERVFIKAKVNL